MKIRKRIFDIIIAGLGLLITLPIMAFISIAIIIDSKGPILYYWRNKKNRFPVYRIGKNGQPFRYFKFRTMIIDKSQPNGLRITRVGRFLRCWHLDELPELLIVLRGDMSIVGPRPHTKDASRKQPPGFYKSFVVQPGITGPAQIFGGRNLKPDEEAEVNLNYMRNWCLLNDIYILAQTPLAIVLQRDEFQH